MTAEDLLKKEAQWHAKLDSFSEQQQQNIVERVDQLVHETDDRDEEIFELLGVDPTVTAAEYDEIPIADRDLQTWIVGYAALFSAAYAQALAEAMPGFWDIVEWRQEKFPQEIETSELKRAATDGITRAQIKAAKAELAERAKQGGTQ